MARRPLLKQPDESVAPEDAALDKPADQEQPAKSGAIDEVELSRAVARKIGWKPKEEWDRAPENWRDAPEFLEQAPLKLKALQESNRTLSERIKRNAQAAADAIEETQRQAREQLQAGIRTAAEAQDPDTAEKLAAQLARTNVPPATAAWVAKNPWFNEDPDAQALAKQVAERSSRAGATTEEQLAAAETAVRKRFPEHFDPAVEEKPRREDSEPREEVRLSDSRQRAAIPPAVAGGSRGGTGAQKEKGFADISQGDQALYRKHFQRRFEGRGMTTEQAQEKYAKSYWRTQA